MVKVLFFARLREQLATESLEVELTADMTVEIIRQHLAQKSPLWQKTLNADNLLVAVNQQITDWSHSINDGDEVAFFPPVTGG